MEIIVPDPSYDHEDEVDRSQFIIELETQLASISSEIEVRETNLGRGADWPAFLIVVGGLFLLGKQINENLDAWISIAKKLNRVLKWVLSKCVSYRVDESGATLIAVNDIASSNKAEITSIERVSSAYVPFLEWDGRSVESLSHHPDGIYTQTYVVNSTQVVIYAIKSDGSIELKSIHPIEVPYG